MHLRFIPLKSLVVRFAMRMTAMSSGHHVLIVPMMSIMRRFLQCFYTLGVGFCSLFCSGLFNNKSALACLAWHLIPRLGRGWREISGDAGCRFVLSSPSILAITSDGFYMLAVGLCCLPWSSLFQPLHMSHDILHQWHFLWSLTL